MARVHYRVRTGHPDRILDQLLDDVSVYTSDHSVFKIGRTSRPEARAKHPHYVAEYKEMIVIYKTTSAAYADQVERHLITSFQKSANFRGGGGGPRGEPPYFVYVVRRKSFLDSILGIFRR